MAPDDARFVRRLRGRPALKIADRVDGWRRGGSVRGMARRLRLQFAGAIYHVTFRGNARQAIFGDDWDRERLTGRVGESAEDFGVRIYLYCWMEPRAPAGGDAGGEPERVHGQRADRVHGLSPRNWACAAARPSATWFAGSRRAAVSTRTRRISCGESPARRGRSDRGSR